MLFRKKKYKFFLLTTLALKGDLGGRPRRGLGSPRRDVSTPAGRVFAVVSSPWVCQCLKSVSSGCQLVKKAPLQKKTKLGEWLRNLGTYREELIPTPCWSLCSPQGCRGEAAAAVSDSPSLHRPGRAQKALLEEGAPSLLGYPSCSPFLQGWACRDQRCRSPFLAAWTGFMAAQGNETANLAPAAR